MSSTLTRAERRWYRLLGTGSDADYMRSTLLGLKQGLSELWGTAHVVRNFTDHGVAHTERVIGILWDLYRQRNVAFGQLSRDEVFVLISASYLHDIGMQCTDPTILRGVGIRTNTVFPSHYTQTEQEQIRRKHSELSVAMARSAFQTRRRSPVRYIAALREVRSDLVSPCLDVIRYHSASDLTRCQEYFLGTERRRILASLLRLADEIDITKDRVNINDISLYPRPLLSEYWWWVHYYTTLIQIKNNRATFYLRLNHSDRKHKSDLEVAIVERFIFKNRQVVDLLSTANIPLVFGHDVRWELDRNILKIPPLMLNLVSEERNRYFREVIGQYQKDYQFAMENYGRLRRRFSNRYVAVRGGRVVGSHVNLNSLWRGLGYMTRDYAIVFVSRNKPARFIFGWGMGADTE